MVCRVWRNKRHHRAYSAFGGPPSMIEAHEPPAPNEWVRPVSLGVTGLLIVWNVVGWMTSKGLTFEGFFISAMTAAFALLSFNASAQMRRASAKQQTPAIRKAHRFWTGVLFMCSLWSAYSAHHAFGVIVATDVHFAWTMEAVVAIVANAPALVVLTVAAFVEPFLPWAIETVESAPGPIVSAPKPFPEASDRPSQNGPSAASRNAGKALARELRNSSPRSRERAPMTNQRPIRERAPPLSEAEIREAIAEMTRTGEVINFSTISKKKGVPYSRVERSPGRHLIAAFAA